MQKLSFKSETSGTELFISKENMYMYYLNAVNN